MALYGATKSFLDNFTTALYRELAGKRVHVSVVRAGPVKTEFCETAPQQENGMHVPTERVGVTSEQVAQRIWTLIRHPRRVIYIPGWLRVVPWAELTFGWMIDRAGTLAVDKTKKGGRIG
ncbi:MAG: SDR family NAD(P)-dependent oxidoreductase, partial [Chloroflexi bacterium]|nr:SDR family NAD(P)-dependent oxidoreductase [Chloroflexota bacterium]